MVVFGDFRLDTLYLPAYSDACKLVTISSDAVLVSVQDMVSPACSLQEGEAQRLAW